MPLFLIRSERNAGVLDTDSGSVTIRGKVSRVDPHLVVQEGDFLMIKGEKFLVKGFSPFDFPLVSRRGAQIIQPWDSAVLTSYCAIFPGSTVLESGVGSGSLSYVILRHLGGHGKLVSVDIDATAISLASENLKSLLTPEEFSAWGPVTGDVNEIALKQLFSAVILDVPEPWAALPTVKASMKPGAVLAFYCPTFDQVEKTFIELEKNDLLFLESMEIINRRLLVRTNATRPDNDMIGHTAFLSFAVRKSGITART